MAGSFSDIDYVFTGDSSSSEQENDDSSRLPSAGAHRKTIININIYFLKTTHDKNILKKASNKVKNTLLLVNFW